MLHWHLLMSLVTYIWTHRCHLCILAPNVLTKCNWSPNTWYVLQDHTFNSSTSSCKLRLRLQSFTFLFIPIFSTLSSQLSVHTRLTRAVFLFMTPAMVWCERGIQVLLTTVGAFAAFALMTVAIGTDYWLYARAFICNSTANSSQDDPHNKDKKDPGALTHSGLWRICCLEG